MSTWEERKFTKALDKPIVSMLVNEPGIDHVLTQIEKAAKDLAFELKYQGWIPDEPLDGVTLFKEQNHALEHEGILRKKMYLTIRSVTVRFKREVD